MSNTRLNWKVGGEAGYGIMTVGEIFSRAFVRGGYYVVAHTEYPSLIRGGHNTFQVRIDDTLIRAPIRPIDVLVALNAKTVDLHLDEVVPSGIIVHDSKSFKAAQRRNDVTWCDVPLAQLVKDLNLPKVTLNMAAMGASVALIGYDLNVLNDVIRDFFKDKGHEIAEQNTTAAAAGHTYVTQNYPEAYKGGMPPIAKAGRMTLSGNDAICMGA
ncbi:MAG: 2-oxoacid:acceptor oxidoreductase family protein, partial [Halobacteriota archaeon]